MLKLFNQISIEKNRHLYGKTSKRFYIRTSLQKNKKVILNENST